MSVKATAVQRTRAALCRHARRLFAKNGYADTSVDEIVRRAKVTKGALYHHFTDKSQLFRAVVEEMEAELVARINDAAAAEDDAWVRLDVMCRVYLDACLNTDVQRILVHDAPVVLGWKVWCDIDREYGIGVFATGLKGAMDAGVMERQPPETLAHVLLGALNNAARVIAVAPEPAAARTHVGQSIQRLVSGLRAPVK
jgi:AcrR family transcriptional regulator